MDSKAGYGAMSAKFFEMSNSCSICSSGRGCNAQFLEVTEFLCQVDISIAGMAVGSGSASGASFLNLWTWKREQ